MTKEEVKSLVAYFSGLSINKIHKMDGFHFRFMMWWEASEYAIGCSINPYNFKHGEYRWTIRDVDKKSEYDVLLNVDERTIHFRDICLSKYCLQTKAFFCWDVRKIF